MGKYNDSDMEFEYIPPELTNYSIDLSITFNIHSINDLYIKNRALQLYIGSYLM